MATTHISEAEAAKDFEAFMAKLRAGEEVIVESDNHPPAVVKLAQPLGGRPITEILAAMETREKELGFSPSMDDDFVADMEEIIRNRKPADHSAWD